MTNKIISKPRKLWPIAMERMGAFRTTMQSTLSEELFTTFDFGQNW